MNWKTNARISRLLFRRIVEDVPPPKPQALAGDEHPFKMLVTTLEADNFLGRILTGRIESGAITVNRNIKALNRDGEIIEKTSASPSFWPSAAWPACRWSAPKPATSSPLPDWKRPRSPTRSAISRWKRRSPPSHRSADSGDDHLGQ